MERPPETQITEIRLGGRPYRVRGEVNREFSNLFSRKVNQGDPRPEDHPTLASAIQTDWSGGALVNDQNPASDMSRFRFSTAETQYPGALALGPYTFSFSGPDDEEIAPWMIGDFHEFFHIAWGTNLYKHDMVTNTRTLVGTLTHSAAGKGTVYREGTAPYGLYLFIPTANGYNTVSTAGVITNGTDTDPVVAFAIWSDKLFKLMGDGSIWYTTKLPTVAGDWVRVTAVPDGSRPRRMFRFYNKANEPCLFVTTDAGGWKLDFANSLLHQDDLEYPKSPDAGRAAIQHQSTGYIAAGTGVWRYDNNILSPMGLDSRRGLPQEFRGFITDFASLQNGLYALIQGQTMESTGIEESAYLQTGPGGLSFSTTATTTRNLVMIHNGFGWHYRWDGIGSAPTNIVTSNSQNVYSVWWGAGHEAYMQIVPRTYFNPDDLDTAGYYFREQSYHEQPWYAWGWLGQDKIMKEIELSASRLESTGASVEVFYKLDREENEWESLGTITEDGEHRFPVGLDPVEPVLRDGTTHHRGQRHSRFKLMFILNRGPDISTTPIIEWHAVISRRYLRPVRFWRMRLDLTEKVSDFTVEQQMDHLIRLSLAEEGVVFEHGHKKYMAEVVIVDGPESTGRNTIGFVDLTLMESRPLTLSDYVGHVGE